MLLIAVCGCFGGALANAANSLEGIFVSKNNGTVSVDIRFDCPTRYVDYFPLTSTDRAQINLMPLDQCNQGLHLSPTREARFPAGREMAALDNVEYVVRGNSEAFLLMRFVQPVRVSVKQSNDLQSLRVTVEWTDESTPASTAIATPELAVPGSAAIVTEQTIDRSPAQMQQAEEVARRRMTLAAAAELPERGHYVINLESSRTPLDPPAMSDLPGLGSAQLYMTEVRIDGKTWHRLRLGFFQTEQEAEAVLQKQRAAYPQAWTAKISADEFALADANAVQAWDDRRIEADESMRAVAAPATPISGPPAKITAKSEVPGSQSPGFDSGIDSEPANTDLDDEQLAKLAELMAEAKTAMVAKEFNRAIQLYTKVLRDPAHPYSQEAQELLGLARERNGQTAHAVAEYRRYLELYPKDEGAQRVGQRLAGLTTTKKATDSRRQASGSRDEPGRWDVFGGISQYYRRDVNQFESQDEIVSQSSVLTDLDLVARRRGESYDFSSRLTMGNLHDLLGQDEGPGNSSRIYYLYADVVDRQHDVSARLGRQALHHSGVLGRFDGAGLSYQWRPSTRFNIVAGFPVVTTQDGVETDRTLYGFSTDLSQVLDLFDLSFFYNTQSVDGIEDRQAIGGEVRYFDDRRSLITALDYDVSYSVLNSLVMFGNWSFDNRITVNGSVDIRRSPFLTTRNALIGQQARSIEELLLTFTESEIRQLALERSGEIHTYTIGASRPLFDRFQIQGDITMTSFEGTPVSGGAAEMPDLDNEFYYNLNLIGSSLMREGDSSIIGLRYTDGNTVDTTTLTLDTRYPVTNGLRINPRIRLSYRDITRDNSTQWLTAPSLRFLYRIAKRYRLEFEVGGEWSSRDTDTDSIDTSSYFIYGGYRADF
jgi:tetratricopeptide (TPR) repeat protein